MRAFYENAQEDFKLLQNLFPQLKSAHYDQKLFERIKEGNVISGFNNLTLIPRWQELFENYECAKIALFKLLEKQFEKFEDLVGKENHNSLERFLQGKKPSDEKIYFQRNISTERSLESLWISQERNQIVVVVTQFDLKYRGCEVRNIPTSENFSLGEFGLGIWEVGIILLIHPEKIKPFNFLEICCPGEEWQPVDRGFRKNDESSFSVPKFVWHGKENKLELGRKNKIIGGEHYFSSATGIVL